MRRRTVSGTMVPAERLVKGVVPEGSVTRDRSSILKNFEHLYGVWIQSLSENTRRAYGKDLKAFTEWHGVADERRLADALSRLNASEANMATLEWQNNLVAQKLSPATINRMVSALKSFVKLLRMNGLVAWSIEIPRRKAKSYKDTKGCGTEAVEDVIKRLTSDDTPAGARDEAIVRLLWGLGLRRGEVSNLDVVHVNFKTKKLSILGKGRHEREELDITDKMISAIQRWLDHRGIKPGALFWNFTSSGDAKRLSGQGVWRITQRRGLGRPHGVRHASITQALENSNGDIRTTMRHSRHSNPATLMLYDDNRRNSARKVSEGLEGNI